MSRHLRHGFTTGTCAAAAALGAARMLREQMPVAAVAIALPAGFTAVLPVAGQHFTSREARCYVVKDAGDDPDVTHGVSIHATVRRVSAGEEAGAALSPGAAPVPGEKERHFSDVVIKGGPGIGRVTKPGLAVAVGEWAINPVPRQMIQQAIRSVFPQMPGGEGLEVILSIPDGAERARKTLNERLGIHGGLSILGTSGVVKPVSHKAWTDTLEVAIDVALASGSRTVVLSTGRTSEACARETFGLPEEAFVTMGDHVSYALQACHRKGTPAVVVALQFAKLVKIAAGHGQTHVRSSRLELAELAEWVREAGLDGGLAKKIECANTAREVFAELAPGHPLPALVAQRALSRLQQWAPGVKITILLAGYGGASPQRFGP